MLSLFAVFQLFQYGITIHFRHHDIEQYDIRQRPLHYVEAMFAIVCRLYRVPLCLKHRCHKVQV